MLVRCEARSLRRAMRLRFGAALLALASFGYAPSAQAERDFPEPLRNALNKRFPGSDFCVPLCNACHLTTLGGPGMFNKFGAALLGSGLVKDDPSLVEAALNKELDQKLYVDGDGVTDADELTAGQSPAFVGAPLCPGDSPTYGCGARIASAPPPIDEVGLFSAGLVMLGLIGLRRRRRQLAVIEGVRLLATDREPMLKK